MGLRDVGDTLPPGFRFYPSDEELVCHYLYKKIADEQLVRGTLVEIDLHVCEPWQLPDVAKLNSNEWYFFSFRDRKYATGFRTNRATTSGYWKATGKDRSVLDPKTGALVGMRKTLVFYKNRAPNGIKTEWIMHEFRLQDPRLPPKEDWVLCRVFYKSRSGGTNGNTLMISSTPRDDNLHIPICPNVAAAYSPQNKPNCGTPFSSGPILDHNHLLLHRQNPIASPAGLWAKCLHEPLGKMVAAETKCEYDDYVLFMLDFDGSSAQDMQVGFGDDNSSVFV